MNPQIFTAIITLTVGLMATAFTYKNYHLNKTLNIKNNLFNEKLKVYREMSKNLVELIVELDEMENDLIHKNTATLEAHASWVENKCKQINAQVIEASVILPKKILMQLSEVIELLYFSCGKKTSENELSEYQQQVDSLRKSAKKILKLFRKDLGIKTLNNQKLTA
jgi:hypothetical protein